VHRPAGAYAAIHGSILRERIMISSVNSLATHAVTVLTGQKRALIPVEPVAPVKIVKRRTGHTDDIFKAGNAIGSMIAIASGMEKSGRTISTDSTDGVEEPRGDTTAAAGLVPTDEDFQERGMEAIRLRAAGTGALAEWARAYLESRESRMRHRVSADAQG
jgi:hypothetical protein